jgi:putative transposase
MPRVARIVIPGVPHRITQRGNNRQDVFFVDDDRRVYLELLAAQAERFGLKLLGYCLMDNHVHLIGMPRGEASLAKAVGRAHFLYTQYVNRLHGRSGHLWQNRFYSCALDDEHLWNALGYVERNPVRARVVRGAWNYRWSSAAAHVGEGSPGELLDLTEWCERWTPAKWRSQLTRRDDDQAVARLRLCTQRGRPLGSDRFVSKLERLVGRRLRPLPIGRPRKQKETKENRGQRGGTKGRNK